MKLDEHDIDEDGWHEEERCELCLERTRTVSCDRCCGKCCESLLVEATLRDVAREPRIKNSPVIKGITHEVEGYLLNAPDGPCAFLDRKTGLCTIYDTRPLVCRLFRCDQPGSPIPDHGHGNGIP